MKRNSPSELRDEVVHSLRARLGNVPVVRQLSWRVGKTLHHTVPRVVGGSGSSRSSADDRQTDPSARRCYTGETIPTYPYRDAPFDPIALRPSPDAANPVLTARDVTDYGRVGGVADPFLFVTASGEWHMFFEIFNQDADPTAVIGHATSPDGGSSWEYDRVVLRTDAHLSFPYVFAWEGTHYLLPDPWDKSSGTAEIRLYEAQNFPYDWTEAATILSPDSPVSDTVVFRWGGRWWAVAGDERDLYAYHSPRLRSDDWQPHADNPVVEDRPRAARPAGRPIVRENRVLLFLQQCIAGYGEQVRTFEITDLTPESYADAELDSSPTIRASDSSVGWNSGKMHHVDPWFDGTTWRCAVDGNIDWGRGVFGHNWSIGMYESVASASRPADAREERNTLSPEFQR
ncbi:hypothetical protein M0R89_19200 (plasmid) [Halorussus limi]|uniref:Glucosamine inositolphosphorylceramide transferase 1 N-terminal domain-containing protein n=1 Tax=Halorussus limi TaxID=2938695 RepID=A0A8U0I065_9EURY|nr:hypothetical protein [Halorussus limi]UPV76660.1 hypothetical protein M0R89_19200 [Halorussus limi]